MSNYDEDDDYWNAPSKPKFNPFYDEDDDQSDAKLFAESGRKNLFSDEDTDSLGGYAEAVTEFPAPAAVESAVGMSSATAVRFQRAGSARLHTTGSFSSDKSSPVPQAWASDSSEIKTPIVADSDPRHHRRSPSSISDIVAATAREPTKSDIAKLETKIKRLEIQLETQSVGSLAVEETIKRMLCGKAYLLESYRKLEDKRYLLRCALNTHDGNTINAVLLFLQRSLTKSLFDRVLREEGGAEQYVSYLRQVDEPAEAEDIVAMIGKSDEAAMMGYRSAVRAQFIDHKVTQLRKCLRNHFEDPFLSSDRAHLENQISLLELQQIIEKTDTELEATGRHPIMRQHKRRGTLPNQPLLTTLYYCCLYHYDQPNNQFASPQYLKGKFLLTDVQFQWIATAALARIHKWNHLEQIFTGKKWYGAATMTTVIGFTNVVKILSKNKTTPDVVNRYCALISDEEERLTTALKYHCNTTAIDTLVSMKDRAQLMQFRKTLPYSSVESQKADSALRNSSIKWKN